MIRLMVGLYNEPDEARFREIYSCLESNLELFSKVVVFLEDERARERFEPLIAFCEQVPLGRRMTFGDALADPERRGVNVLSNNDIAFDTSIAEFESVGKNEFWCLTRRDPDPLGRDKSGKFPPCPEQTQDAWAWRSPVLEFVDTKFPLGVLGCDHRIAFEARRAGYKLRNPAGRVILEHRHASGVRRPLPRLEGGYEYVPLEV